VPLVKLAKNRKALIDAVDKITPGGGTNILPGLKEAADALNGSKATHKHVVLLTDGEAPTDGIAELTKKMHDDHETITCVGVPGADRALLSMIADAGGGRLYMVEDVSVLPRIFVKEIAEAQRAP